ncbi:MAG TPA: cytochrome c oxidase subunit II [Usitatibacter sp.]|jgi:cytochrome c oxidase subunit 2|nr:cytochrome c oxidase subunit II [Usitatibacter sp.]
MTHPPEWLLPAASEGAGRIDALFFSLLALTGFVAVAIALVALVFCVKYRRGSAADRSDPPSQLKALEIAWSTIPLVIFIGIFVWGARVYASLYQPADGAMKVFAVGKQWMWRIEHANGRREIDELHLPVDEPVRIVIATEDVIHSFYIPAFRVKQDAVPGRYTGLTVTPTRVGTYELLCSEYCGTDHARMGGHVIVMPKAQFAKWLAEGAPAGSMAAQGKATFQRLGCTGCHDPRSSLHAPELAGLFGRAVHLQDGRTVIADEAYIRDSILLPKKDVVAGFEPVMPSYQGQASEGDLLELIAYLRAQ